MPFTRTIDSTNQLSIKYYIKTRRWTKEVTLIVALAEEEDEGDRGPDGGREQDKERLVNISQQQTGSALYCCLKL